MVFRIRCSFKIIMLKQLNDRLESCFIKNKLKINNKGKIAIVMSKKVIQF
jgi:hypothetical protein